MVDLVALAQKLLSAAFEANCWTKRKTPALLVLHNIFQFYNGNGPI